MGNVQRNMQEIPSSQSTTSATLVNRIEPK